MESTRGMEIKARSLYLRREVLTANRTYFVRADGNNFNNGLTNTSSGAFRQISKAIELIEKLDLNGFLVTVKVADGTYDSFRILKGLTGGKCIIEGNPTSPQSCIIQEVGTDGYGIDIQDSWASYTITGFEIRVDFTANSVISVASGNTDKICLSINNSSVTIENIRYNSTSGGNGYHLRIFSSNVISASGGHSFIGNAFCAINLSQSNFNAIDFPATGFPSNTATQINFNSNTWGFGLGVVLLLQGHIDFFNRRFSGSWSGGNFGRIEAGSIRLRHTQLPGNVQSATVQNGGVFMVSTQ